MGKLLSIWRFAWTYARQYWFRFCLGILFGLLFGAVNGSLVFVMRSFTERLSLPAAQSQAAPAQPEGQSALAPVDSLRRDLQNRMDRVIDEWLPRVGAKLSWKQALGGILLLPLIMSLRGVCDYISNYCLAWVNQRVVNDMRVDVLRKLYTLSLDYFTKSTTGDMFTRINSDTAVVLRTLQTGIVDTFKESFTVIAVTGALFWLDWKLTLFGFLVIPLCGVPTIFLGLKARRANKRATAVAVAQNGLLIEMLAGIRVVKAFCLEGRMLEHFRLASRKLVHLAMKGVQARETAGPIVEVISVFGLGLLAVYMLWQERNLSDLVAFLGGLFLFFKPIKRLAGVHILFEQARASIDRLVEVLNERPTVVETAHPAQVKGFQEHITFQHVFFRYGKKEVLHDVDFRLDCGRKLGIAGESGSGKSTIVNLIHRFYDPTDGRVLFDGHDLRALASSSYRSQMALVSQEVILFKTTVAENIALGREGATRDEIEAAARAANAHEFIMQMPQGYDTTLAERGRNLSGGQRQRIAIARAFVRNAPLLILDEATASLDSQSEAEVQAAIEKLERDRTVVCIAHRLSTLRFMDQVLVLSQGRIVERGTFEGLLSAGGVFARMAARQGILPH